MAKHSYTVIVGNIGNVHTGANRARALVDYHEYVGISKAGRGRAGNEDVHLYCDSQLVRYHDGQTHKQAKEDTKARRVASEKARLVGSRQVVAPTDCLDVDDTGNETLAIITHSYRDLVLMATEGLMPINARFIMLE